MLGCLQLVVQCILQQHLHKSQAGLPNDVSWLWAVCEASVQASQLPSYLFLRWESYPGAVGSTCSMSAVFSVSRAGFAADVCECEGEGERLLSRAPSWLFLPIFVPEIFGRTAWFGHLIPPVGHSLVCVCCLRHPLRLNLAVCGGNLL